MRSIESARVSVRVLPEVLQKVLRVKAALARHDFPSVQRACQAYQLSRSSFYKYRDEIAPLSVEGRGWTVHLDLRNSYAEGVLMRVLELLNDDATSLRQMQQIPDSSGTARLLLDLDWMGEVEDLEKRLDQIRALHGVRELRSEIFERF